MTIVDKINTKYNKDTLLFGSQSFDKTKFYKKINKSKDFTSNWDELLKVNA